MLYFFAGVLLLLLDLVSPLDALADDYLFSAHIVQHFFLALIIPPLLLLGLPRGLKVVEVPGRALLAARRWRHAGLAHPDVLQCGLG